jgi:hypothetical protein
MTDDKLRQATPAVSWVFESVIGKACALPSARLIAHREIQLPPTGARDDGGGKKGSL